jgi:xanthine dehydrogenase large subunit
MPEEFHVDFLEHARDADVVFGSKAVGEPPLMLAISVREALRDAVAAFGGGGPVKLGCPATPEKVFFAMRDARATCDSAAVLRAPERQGNFAHSTPREAAAADGSGEGHSAASQSAATDGERHSSPRESALADGSGERHSTPPEAADAEGPAEDTPAVAVTEEAAKR